MPYKLIIFGALCLTTGAASPAYSSEADADEMRAVVRSVMIGENKPASILVEEEPLGQGRRTVFYLDADTTVRYADNQAATPADLCSGQRVRILHTNAFNDSKPPQGLARMIVIEGARPK